MPSIQSLEMAKSMHLIEDYKVVDNQIYLKARYTNEFVLTTDTITEDRILEDS